MGNQNAADDAKKYREGYPGLGDDLNENRNLEFYSNQRSSKPEGDLVENIHKKWWGKYGLLEAHHGYIQWLFPIREDGLNSQAQILQPHEAKAILSDPVKQSRVVRSYELMLDFYGMKLVDQTTGALGRSDGWKERYRNLNSSFHNYLRITRVLKCLGEMGLEHLKKPFVEFVLSEIYENGELVNCHESCVKYWCEVIRSGEEREAIHNLVAKYDETKPLRKKFSRWSEEDEEDERWMKKAPKRIDDPDKKKEEEKTKEVNTEKEVNKEKEEKGEKEEKEEKEVKGEKEEKEEKEVKPKNDVEEKENKEDEEKMTEHQTDAN